MVFARYARMKVSSVTATDFAVFNLWRMLFALEKNPKNSSLVEHFRLKNCIQVSKILAVARSEEDRWSEILWKTTAQLFSSSNSVERKAKVALSATDSRMRYANAPNQAMRSAQ